MALVWLSERVNEGRTDCKSYREPSNESVTGQVPRGTKVHYVRTYVLPIGLQSLDRITDHMYIYI